MHIVYTLFWVTFVFLFALTLMCLFREKMKNHPVINAIIILFCAFSILAWNYATYDQYGLDAGFITFDNISPYICTLIAFSPIFNKKFNDFFFSCVAFLGFAMFIAMYVNTISSILLEYNKEAMFIHMSDAACHLGMGLYGFYLVLSDRVKVTPRNFYKGVAFIYSTFAFVLTMNYLFHRSYFGMNMYGDYRIYFLQIFGSFEITLLAFLIGVFAAMALGFFICLGIDRLSRRRDVSITIQRIFDDLEKDKELN